MKNALITASTKGMGRAIAIAFAKEGINLAVCSRNASDLDAFKSELSAINPNIKIVTSVTDVSIKQQLLDFAAAAEAQLGAIGIIVNNAGIYEYSSILDDADGTLEKHVNTNLAPAYELYRYFGKKMINACDGHIFNICSVASLSPIAEAGTYSVTKYALLGLNKVMRTEMQPHGIKVTAVIPGSTLTDSWKGTQVDKDKMVLPEDVASAIVNIYKMSSGANVDEIVITPTYGQI
ncbi:SDR family oxidoreductase [Mucilaginibacter sp. BJC16-A38]|uniref:SDR family NAD(P)-dependent oxidoreductase n=1 Tax=Mucilaginibacter phenanthrenivorans TaxID=1234842 RepID=UPI00215898FE|nr:SDR family oxidoreductase [Mucilaginibacter phenanthrenivorans]MCR8558744.1 SDR family oxidoreductase [Mucilaginibacter phenanthrenivorans]